VNAGEVRLALLSLLCHLKKLCFILSIYYLYIVPFSPVMLHMGHETGAVAYPFGGELSAMMLMTKAGPPLYIILAYYYYISYRPYMRLVPYLPLYGG
jgi:hypothetical protein